MKRISILVLALFLLTASAPFIPLWNSGDSLLEIHEGEKGRSAALLFADSLHAHPRCLFTFSYSAASLMYGPAKAGCYRPGRTSAFSAMKSLCSGNLVKITVTEGMASSDIARVISKTTGENNESEEKLRVFLSRSEGRLFPATYPLRTRDPRQLSAEMEAKFDSAAKPFSKEELVIASIVQKEAKYRKDFRRCAGVIRNRLARKMNLECDSVYQYELGPVRVTKDLIAQDSPYNTFLRKGLPPSPICSPGLAALEAAHSPEEHTYLYFVAKKDGSLYFSKDSHEHYKAVEFYVLGRPNGFRPKPQ